jgi:hypothetical protein
MGVRDSVMRLAGTLSLVTMLLVAGCSSSDSPPVPQPQLKGIVQSGGTASTRGLANAAVRWYEVSSGAPRLLGTATTNQAGNFAIAIPNSTVAGVSFVTARVGSGVDLIAALGKPVPDFVTINELTTVAAAFSFAQFYNDTEIRGDNLALSIAAGMNANLVNVATGGSSSVLLSSPNADQTNSLRSTMNLANFIAGCVRQPGLCPVVFALATPPGGPPPTSTLRALVNVAHNPAVNVAGIFSQSQEAEPYEPNLAAAPDAWTLAVKVNDTGSGTTPFGGAANTVFDDKGYAWINNNTIQGQSISAMSVIVLKPDGSPADGSNGTPKSPVTGGGVFGAGFGISRSVQDGSIWVGNFGWGGDNPGPEGNGDGCVSQFADDGNTISPANGYDGGTDRVQGIVADHSGNIWTANFGNNKLVVFPAGDPDRALAQDLPCHPFGVAVAADGTAWVSTIGGGLLTEPALCVHNSTVSHWRLDTDRLDKLSETEVGAELKGLDIDFEGFVWVASGGDDTVYRLDPTGSVVGAYQGGGIDAPWAVRIDDAGNVWVANFGVMDILPPNNIYDNAALSVLAGPNSPSGLPVGTPISPSTGYTLPSAGAPVLLSDGTPLNETGDGKQPAFTPLMRAVSAVPDRAGNVWVSNNWKPNFTSDLVGDPGGDGMVIFIGLAAPTQPGRTQ